MRNFLFAGKINKIFIVIVLFLLPLFLKSVFSIQDDLGLSFILSFIFEIILLKIIYKQTALKEIIKVKKINYKKCIIFFMYGLFLTAFIIVSYIKFGFGMEDSGISLAIIGHSIIAPITEEFVFRYIISKIWFDESQDDKQQLIKLAVCGSFLWSLIHIQYIFFFPIHNLVIFLMGMILYHIYFKTQNIFYCIIVHVSFNLTQRVIFFPMQESVYDLMFNNIVYIFFITVTFILSMIMLKKGIKIEET